MDRKLQQEIQLPEWAVQRPYGWHYAGWIPYTADNLDSLVEHAKLSDHGEIRDWDIYQEGYVFWWKENKNA